MRSLQATIESILSLLQQQKGSAIGLQKDEASTSIAQGHKLKAMGDEPTNSTAQFFKINTQQNNLRDAQQIIAPHVHYDFKQILDWLMLIEVLSLK